MRFAFTDRTALKIKPLSDRQNDLGVSIISELNTIKRSEVDKKFNKVAKHIIHAKKNSASAILMMGAHVIRSGVQRYLIDLMRRGFISCIAMNGAGMIHDFEFALIGATTESVSKYINEGQFGLWKETGRINDIINKGYNDGLGMGEAVGQAIYDENFPFKDISLLASAYVLKIPVTVHVGIGCDIIHEHPNCDGAATGAMSYKDFLYFAKIVENLEDGIVMNFGSAVMAPEVFLKALSMARNIAHQQGEIIKHFSTLVCDLHELPDDYSKEPPKNSSAYYFRPFKTMLFRTVADGGESFYVKGNHSDTIPSLWTAINDEETITHENIKV
jgi:uncharacterized protein (DUF779 family)